MLRADKLTTFTCRLSWNLGASTSWVVRDWLYPVLGFRLFCGYFSGWRMGDVGGKGRVEPGEDQRRFENMGKSPKKGDKNFQNIGFWKCRYFRKCLVTPYLLVCFWRENVRERSTKCAARTPTPQWHLHGAGSVWWRAVLLAQYWSLYRDFWLFIITLVEIGRKKYSF